MNAEKEIEKQMDLNEKTIKEAQMMMDKMAALRGKLHIRDGAGQRYLQKLKPEQGVLQLAEKQIMSEYASPETTIKPSSGKKSKLLRNMAKRNTI